MNDPILWLLLIACTVVAVLVGLGVWRGALSWRTATAIMGALLAGVGGAALITRRRPHERLRDHVPLPPPPEPAAAAVAPVVAVADGQADADRDSIRDAEADTDRRSRLDRLAGLNDGGR